jgi:hypothetical protein
MTGVSQMSSPRDRRLAATASKPGGSEHPTAAGRSATMRHSRDAPAALLHDDQDKHRFVPLTA